MKKVQYIKTPTDKPVSVARLVGHWECDGIELARLRWRPGEGYSVFGLLLNLANEFAILPLEARDDGDAVLAACVAIAVAQQKIAREANGYVDFFFAQRYRAYSGEPK